ncbi:MAG: cysteine desulfurase [Spirochaetales bacterium]|jgi:cysteine desulfurase|nr:cysteine desulfurase [Spirochaetales bacterium]
MSPLKKFCRGLERTGKVGYGQSMREIYLDWAASALPDREAHKAGLEGALKNFGNPSSPHRCGRRAAEALEECRRSLAENLGIEDRQLIFTSGGTESNNLIFNSLLLNRRAGREASSGTEDGPPLVVLSGYEHPSVWEPARLLSQAGFRVLTVDLGKDGRFDLTKLRGALEQNPVLVSVMGVNNETGLRSPLGEIGALIREKERGRRIFFHSDLVQAWGGERPGLKSWDLDAASFSGHKLGAPKGTGLLYLRAPEPRLNRGGGQEQGVRSGTENLPGALALAEAVRRRSAGLEADIKKAGEIKYFFIEGLTLMGASLSAPIAALTGKDYSPWILWASFPPLPGEVLARALDDRSVRVSTGSACASRGPRNYRVTRALGIPDELAFSALRLSWGPETREEEALAFLLILKKTLRALAIPLKPPAAGAIK